MKHKPIHMIPTPQQFLEMSKKLKRYQVIQKFAYPPAVVYGYLSQVDMLNKVGGNSRVNYVAEPWPDGGSILTAYAKKGALSFVYNELPYEWWYPYGGVADIFTEKGPLAYIRISYQLVKTDGGGEARFEFASISRGIGILGYIGSIAFISVMKKALARVAKDIKPNDPLHVLPYRESADQNHVDRNGLLQSLQNISGDKEAIEAVGDFIATMPDKYLNRIRPLELAKQYHANEQEVISIFLKGTKKGLFSLRWDILCPSCRGNKLETKTLSDVTAQVHCDYCSIDYGLKFDENVELTFRPSPEIRKVNTLSYCMHSPSNTPHVIGQVNVWPGKVSEQIYSMPIGTYRITSLSLRGYIDLKVEDSGSDELSLEVTDFPLEGTYTVCKDFKLKLTSSRKHFTTIRILETKYREAALTAARAFTIQEFRELFSAEILRPGLEVSIENMAILFTDLKDSTPLYEKLGDAEAFSLVNKHFEILINEIKSCDGAVVKTIGDAVMAAFTDPQKAFAAARQILLGIRRWQNRLTVKIGLHSGPCLAVTLNDRLDYFGAMINRAARIQGLSEGNDIVMSGTMFNRYLTLEPNLRIESFRGALKGIAEEQELVRIRLE